MTIRWCLASESTKPSDLKDTLPSILSVKVFRYVYVLAHSDSSATYSYNKEIICYYIKDNYIYELHMTNAPNKREGRHWDHKGCYWNSSRTKDVVFVLRSSSSYSFNHKQPGLIHLSGVHHCSHSNGESHGGHFGKVVPEETGIGYYGVLGKGLHSGPGHETGAGLIKGDVPIWTDAWKKSKARTCKRLMDEMKSCDDSEYNSTCSMNVIMRNTD